MDSQRYSVFLDGEYTTADESYYRELIDSSTSIAVDGGAELFTRLGIAPRLWVGDFDGADLSRQRFDPAPEIIRLDTDKDFTDGEFAVKLAIERGASLISLCGYAGGVNTDHIFANLFLLHHARSFASTEIEVRAERAGERVWALQDENRIVTGVVGDTISVLALDADISVSVEGCDYPATDLKVPRGSTHTLRNRMSAAQCRVSVEGAALLFWRSGLAD